MSIDVDSRVQEFIQKHIFHEYSEITMHSTTVTHDCINNCVRIVNNIPVGSRNRVFLGYVCVACGQHFLKERDVLSHAYHHINSEDHQQRIALTKSECVL